MARAFRWGIVIWTLLDTAAAGAEPSRPPAPSEPRVRFAFEGPVGRYLRNVTDRWLLVAPEANPAMLSVFRDRDRLPLRDLLPWTGEFAGKYLTGGTQLLRVTADPALREKLAAFVRALIALQDADGYLGPFPKGSRLTGQAPNVGGKPGATWDAWGHYHAMLGLILWHDETGSPEALAAAARIGDLLCATFLGEKMPRLVDTGSTEMNLAPAHALALLHERTKAPRYLALARQLVGEFAATDPKGAPLAGDYLRRGLKGDAFFTLPRPRWESLHPVMALATLARIDNDVRDRVAFENLWWSIAELDRHNNGGFSSGEQAQGDPYHTGTIETCCTIAWMAASVEMLRLTGDPVVADELELSTLNSALGLFHPSGRWSTYDTPMDGVRKANYHEIVFQSRPGSPDLNCCSVNAARGLGLIGEWAVTTGSEGVTLNWYGPGSVTVPLGEGSSVKVVQETEYPRGGTVRIRVEPGPGSPTSFTLRLRIPNWSEHTTAAVNGKAVDGITPGTYLAMTRAWKVGDTVDLSLDFSPRYWVGERGKSGFTSVYRGPILLTYDRRFNSIDPADIPALDARDLRLSLKDFDGSLPPIVLVEVPAGGRRTLRLCDFATAGADGSPYLSWLRVDHVAPTPFRRPAPQRTGREARD